MRKFKPKAKPKTTGTKPKPDAPQLIPGVLKLKLGACLTAPTQRMLADLDNIAAMLNCARVSMYRKWMRYHEDNPAFHLENPTRLLPETIPSAHDPTRTVKGDMLLYYAGRKTAPLVSTALISSARQKVIADLKTKVPYTHTGKARLRWQAYLWNECSLPSARGFNIPVPCNQSLFVYGQDCRGANLPGGAPAEEHVRLCGASSCVLAFPAWNPESGRENVYHTARLEVRQLSEGHRQILRRVACGEWKFCDSSLVKHDDGWYFHLTYGQPETASNLPKTRIAVLEATDRNARDPFTVTFTLAGEDKPIRWSVGRGRVLKSAYGRLDARRKNMRHDYGTAGSERKGHGRNRQDRDIKPTTRRVQHLIRDIQAQTVAEVIRFCVRFNCGTLVYHEPSQQWRSRYAWTAANRVQWDWTQFRDALERKCKKNGITLLDKEEGAK